MEKSIETKNTETKSLEDIMIKYEGSVRNANASIVQLIYGNSGTTLEMTKKDSCIHSKDKCDECICRELEEFCMNMDI